MNTTVRFVFVITSKGRRLGGWACGITWNLCRKELHIQQLESIPEAIGEKPLKNNRINLAFYPLIFSSPPAIRTPSEGHNLAFGGRKNKWPVSWLGVVRWSLLRTLSSSPRPGFKDRFPLWCGNAGRRGKTRRGPQSTRVLSVKRTWSACPLNMNGRRMNEPLWCEWTVEEIVYEQFVYKLFFLFEPTKRAVCSPPM